MTLLTYRVTAVKHVSILTEIFMVNGISMPEIAADVRGTEKLQTYRVRLEKKKKSLKSLLFYQNDTLPIYDGNFFVGV